MKIVAHADSGGHPLRRGGARRDPHLRRDAVRGLATDRGGDRLRPGPVGLAPVFPTKVVGVGANYPLHVEEMRRQLPDSPNLFIKPSTSVIGPGKPIMLPPPCRKTYITRPSWRW